ncbi:MAG TPA: response regulator [Gammaproteobacteria bacterium]|nr:response regulator [Gammaproteobacteria bacterium]
MDVASSVVHVLDDDVALCNAIKWLCKSVHLNTRIYNNPHAYLAAYDKNWKGCLLLDVRMPFMTGFEVLEELKKRKNRMPIIMLTSQGDVPMAVRAMKEGAMDFILKPFGEEELLEKIQRAVAGSKTRQNKPNDAVYYAALERMTAREREVMQLIAEGALSKQIAAKLKISVSTVDFHRGNVMRKLHAKTLAELIKVYLYYSQFLD